MGTVQIGKLTMIDISFLVVNYFSGAYTAVLVQSIKKNIKSYSYEILIGDNSIDQKERDIISPLADEKCNVVFFENNKGFVQANNELFSLSNGKVIVLINPDTEIPDDSFEKLIAELLANNTIGIIGPKLLNTDQSYQVSFYKFPTLWTVFQEHMLLVRKHVYAYNTDVNAEQFCDVVKGACLCFRKEIITTPYIFDPDFIMYTEEVEFCFRIVHAGLKTLYYPLANIIHHGEKSTSQEHISAYSLFHYYVSKLLFFRKHGSIFQRILVPSVLFISLLEKSLFLFILGKRESAKLHYATFLRVFIRDRKI